MLAWVLNIFVGGMAGEAFLSFRYQWCSGCLSGLSGLTVPHSCPYVLLCVLMSHLQI